MTWQAFSFRQGPALRDEGHRAVSSVSVTASHQGLPTRSRSSSSIGLVAHGVPVSSMLCPRVPQIMVSQNVDPKREKLVFFLGGCNARTFVVVLLLLVVDLVFLLLVRGWACKGPASRCGLGGVDGERGRDVLDVGDGPYARRQGLATRSLCSSTNCSMFRPRDFT
jgi:hypothetical protein